MGRVLINAIAGNTNSKPIESQKEGEKGSKHETHQTPIHYWERERRKEQEENKITEHASFWIIWANQQT